MSEWYEPPLQFFSFCNKTLICHYNGIVRPDCTQQNEVVFHQMILFVGTTNWLFSWFDNYLGLNDENWLFNLKCNSFHKSRSQFEVIWSDGIHSLRSKRGLVDNGYFWQSLVFYSWGLARQSQLIHWATPQKISFVFSSCLRSMFGDGVWFGSAHFLTMQYVRANRCEQQLIPLMKINLLIDWSIIIRNLFMQRWSHLSCFQHYLQVNQMWGW